MAVVARHAIGGEKFGESSTTGLSRIVYMVTFKSLAGKILAGLDKSGKIFHHQNFPLYGTCYGDVIMESEERIITKQFITFITFIG